MIDANNRQTVIAPVMPKALSRPRVVLSKPMTTSLSKAEMIAASGFLE